MPPTPFHPTHLTPFKSSISSSQQAREKAARWQAAQDNNNNAESTWPQAIEADQLDVRDWTYLAEGGKNLVLRYTGQDRFPFVHQGRRVALRITKAPRGAPESGNSIEVSADGQEIDPVDWQNDILRQHLGDAGAGPSLLPPLLRIACHSADHKRATSTFLRLVASKIEGMRPLERRRKDGIVETATQNVYVTEDLSAPTPGRPNLILEVKPKCGFLPQASTSSSDLSAYLKRQHSRFRMHSVLKREGRLSGEEFEALYDPLDLYSGEASRIDRASSALYDGWIQSQGKANNLRIFIDGKAVQPSEHSSFDALSEALWPGHHLSLAQAVKRILCDQQVQDVLSRLCALQSRCDPLDVEGVDAKCQKELGQSLANLGNEPEIALTEYADFVHHTLTKAPETWSAREAIAGLLLSASFKDCSLFLRISATPPRDGVAGPQIEVHLVDLDPKPIVKLPYLLQIDREIVSTFAQWTAQQGYGTSQLPVGR